ncbi:MAG: molybdenum cofactor guanylyltransferase [Planctomycetota bacterium]|nr:molybdenum cofactor guanylyltransferase [Planctomycetota bacterium]MDA1177716.1 molybdenum cofactor guanylyltransferase [Planctomycetota bacterium]
MERAAIILCGGHSRRMGRPKAWLPFGPETMLQRIVRIVSTEVSTVIVVAAQGQELPPLPAIATVVYDGQRDRGPLQGLARGLQCLSASQVAYVTSCDVPRLNTAFVRAMFDFLPGYDIAVPQEATFCHPLAAVYRSTVLPQVELLLERDQLRPMFLFDQASTRFVPVDDLRAADPELTSLENLNSPEDYERALRASGLA